MWHPINSVSGRGVSRKQTLANNLGFSGLRFRLSPPSITITPEVRLTEDMLHLDDVIRVPALYSHKKTGFRKHVPGTGPSLSDFEWLFAPNKLKRPSNHRGFWDKDLIQKTRAAEMVLDELKLRARTKDPKLKTIVRELKRIFGNIDPKNPSKTLIFNIEPDRITITPLAKSKRQAGSPKASRQVNVFAFPAPSNPAPAE